jgi:hypothetical protein
MGRHSATELGFKAFIGANGGHRFDPEDILIIEKTVKRIMIKKTAKKIK